MIKITIKDWVILFAVLPTLIIGTILGVYFALTRVAEVDNVLINKSKNIAETMSVSVANNITAKNQGNLELYLDYIYGVNSSEVLTLLLFDHANNNLYNNNVANNYPDYRLDDVTQLNAPIVKETAGTFIIYNPVIVVGLVDKDNKQQKKYYGYFVIEISKAGTLFDKQMIILIVLSTVFFGVFLSSNFANRLVLIISGPVKEMNDIVLQIRQGVLGARIDDPFEGELDILRIGINNMAQAIEDYQLDLESNIDQATRDLRAALEQFEIQNVQLDLAKRKAQDANRVKSEFLANMSHELRTPLNGVIGFTRQILKTPLTETQREYLGTIDNSANNLLSIINDILDFSKLDSGRMAIEHIPFGFRDSIDEAIILVSAAAHSKNLELSLNIKPHLPNSLIGDSLRVKQVIINLLGNAIKFTDQGFIKVDVDYEIEDNSDIMISFKVTDTGIGISSKQEETLFEAFSQADKSITRLYGGTGLGLVIAKRLANEMGGDITFTSQPHKGSSFIFTFKTELNQLPVDNIIEPFELEHKSILYIEKNNHSRKATEAILNHWNMQTTSAEDMTHLSDSQLNQHFDYALIGQQVTTTNIPDIQKLIQTLSAKSEKVIIAINSNSLSLKETFIKSGAQSCINKPITNKNLKNTMLVKSSQIEAITDDNKKNIIEKLPLSVLAVDDNEANLKLINSLLSQKVISVKLAKDGREAFNLCRQEKFDLILMDIQMPVMDGISAMKKIKEDSLNVDTCITAVTAHALPGEKEKFIREGFNAYLAKPIDESLLENILLDHSGIENLSPIKNKQNVTYIDKKTTLPDTFNGIYDWNLSLNRSANKIDLALEMFTMLIQSLPEMKVALQNNIRLEDLSTTSALVHKLNGACCYVGVPRLERIVKSIESQIKQQSTLEILEPEFFELFDEIDAVLENSDEYLEYIQAIY
ncbi:two-component sensor histidine kinase BarA [Thalassotalea psychrophila]|uniref:histidine kinase n=1 Tax=Thalassotalea psychrophila TaxID=3065647 RepID=A0ABY9TRL4_9GAMM|nr:two-component sensor histidine kinase BarA [Colwelliaceae bacterium SQ149]